MDVAKRAPVVSSRILLRPTSSSKVNSVFRHLIDSAGPCARNENHSTLHGVKCARGCGQEHFLNFRACVLNHLPGSSKAFRNVLIPNICTGPSCRTSARLCGGEIATVCGWARILIRKCVPKDKYCYMLRVSLNNVPQNRKGL